MNSKRDYNIEIKDTNDHKYAYGFDFDVMHPYMIKSFEPFFNKGSLLELGSFKGDFTRRFLPYFEDVTCIEASDAAVAEAKKKLGDKVKFVNSVFEKATLPKRYDNIVLTHVLEHLDDPVLVLKRINDEWLAENGRFFLVCPNANAPSRQIAVKMGLISHNTAVTSAESEHGHRCTYTLDTLERDAVAAGLKVVHRSGIFFKALANFQWDRLLQTDIISKEYLEGCYKLGQQYPDLCSSIFLMCERGDTPQMLHAKSTEFFVEAQKLNPRNKKTGSGAKPILIFPGGMPRSLEYLQKCLHEGQAVIGASSLALDTSREKYPAWLSLPFVTEPEFGQALKQAISESNIGGIYSPNPVVWDYLRRTLEKLAPGVALVNDSPVNVELSGYRAARGHADSLLNRPLPLASNVAATPSMSAIELAALFRHADVIPGMCDHEKFCVLCEIARRSPAGDIVEIGSWWGKSAFILARLARCYAIGKLLCVDPWSNAHLVQNDEKGMVDIASAQMDAEEALAVFEMNLLPYNANHVNYLRMPSTDGAQHYRACRDVTTASFGTTRYDGHIAILHIDGNHSYAAAKADIAAWGGLVVAGGWIIVDDYIWPYGDGPQRVGDEFMAEHQDKIDVAFVMGSALFLQLSSQLSKD